MKTINNVQKTVKPVITTLALFLILGTSMVSSAANGKSDTASKTRKMMNFQIPAEEQDATLSLEKWMISDSCFVIQEERMQQEHHKISAEPVKPFDYSILEEKATEPKLKLETWMTSTHHWK